MDLSLISWLCAAAGVVFLAACVHHNRKTGYQRTRSNTTIIEEGFLWLEALEASMEEDLPKPAPAAPVPAPATTSHGEQLMNLGQVLAEDAARSPKPVSEHTTVR